MRTYITITRRDYSYANNEMIMKIMKCMIWTELKKTPIDYLNSWRWQDMGQTDIKSLSILLSNFPPPYLFPHLIPLSKITYKQAYESYWVWQPHILLKTIFTALLLILTFFHDISNICLWKYLGLLEPWS